MCSILYTEFAMAIEYKIHIDGDLLTAEARGKPDNAAELRRYGGALVAAGVAGEVTKALLDERELEHTLNEGDIYYLAEQYSASVPGLVKAAIVFDAEYTQNVRFWETCAVNRGLSLKVFMSTESALAWLNDEVVEAIA